MVDRKFAVREIITIYEQYVVKSIPDSNLNLEQLFNKKKKEFLKNNLNVLVTSTLLNFLAVVLTHVYRRGWGLVT